MSRFAKDIWERIGTTFVQGFLIAWLVTQDGTWDSLTQVELLQGAIAGAVLAAAKGLVARQTGNGDSASLANDV